MTSTRNAPPAAAGRHARARLDDDLRGLADQIRRCSGAQSRWMSWKGLARRMRTFTAGHIVSVVAVGVLLLGGLRQLG